MITSAELTRVAIALLALLLVAHAGGALFQRFHQPRVIGEILGGLILGPTVLGQVWPVRSRGCSPTTPPRAR